MQELLDSELQCEACGLNLPGTRRSLRAKLAGYSGRQLGHGLDTPDGSGLDSRSFKGVEGSARNDGVGGNGDGGVGNGDAAEASAESPVKAAKGGGNQGATISPDGDKQRDRQQPDEQRPDKQRPDKQQPDKQQPGKRQSSLFNYVETRKPAGIWNN